MNVFGLDLGAGYEDLYGNGGMLEVQSIIGVKSAGQMVGQMEGMGKRASVPALIESDYGAFYVGPGAHAYGRAVESLDYAQLFGGPAVRALTYYLWSQLPVTERQEMSLVVGLPVGAFPQGRERRALDDTRAWLMGTHTWTMDEAQSFEAKVTHVSATGQPNAALYDWGTDGQGVPLQDRAIVFKGEAGGLTVGFNTVEMINVDGWVPVPGRTGSIKSGVRRLLEANNHQRAYSLGELDAKLRAGKLDVRKTKPAWVREVLGGIEEVWGDAWRRFDVVVAAGGGAILLRDELLSFFGPKLRIPDEPSFAVARGLYKMGLKKATKKGG